VNQIIVCAVIDRAINFLCQLGVSNLSCRRVQLSLLMEPFELIALIFANRMLLLVLLFLSLTITTSRFLSLLAMRLLHIAS